MVGTGLLVLLKRTPYWFGSASRRSWLPPAIMEWVFPTRLFLTRTYAKILLGMWTCRVARRASKPTTIQGIQGRIGSRQTWSQHLGSWIGHRHHWISLDITGSARIRRQNLKYLGVKKHPWSFPDVCRFSMIFQPIDHEIFGAILRVWILSLGDVHMNTYDVMGIIPSWYPEYFIGCIMLYLNLLATKNMGSFA